jgi:hypothetical protein
VISDLDLKNKKPPPPTVSMTGIESLNKKTTIDEANNSANTPLDKPVTPKDDVRIGWSAQDLTELAHAKMEGKEHFELAGRFISDVYYGEW